MTTTLLQLAKTLASIAGTEPRIKNGPPRPGDIRISLGDPGKALRILGVKTKTALGDGLKITVESLAVSITTAA